MDSDRVEVAARVLSHILSKRDLVLAAWDAPTILEAAREAVEAADKAAAPPGDAGQGWCDIASAPAEMHAMAWLWNDGWVAPMVGERLYDDWYLVTHDGDLAKDSGGEPIILCPTHWQPLSPARVRESAARPPGGDMSETCERPMRERLAKAIVPLRYDGCSPEARESSLPNAPFLWENCLPTVDAILAELHEPGFDAIEAAADCMSDMTRQDLSGEADWSSEEIAEAMLRAAIDAIRDEGEAGITPRS